MDRNESAPAIVVKSERHGERDRMATLLSPVWGLRRVLVYGAQKSRKAIKAPLYTEAVFHIYNNRERNFSSLVDLNPISIHENISLDLMTSLAAAMMCDIIIDQRGSEAPACYSLLTECLDALSEDNWKAVCVQFVIRVLEIEGQGTDYRICPVCQREYKADEILGFNASIGSPCCHLCDTLSNNLILPPNARRYLADSLDVDLERALSFTLSDMMLSRLLRYVVRVYRLATGSALKSATSLLESEAIL